MTIRSRIALVAATALLVVLAGTTLATRAPVADRPAQQDANDPEAPDPQAIDHAVERLASNDIEADADQLAELAEVHGMGGAVRLKMWEAHVPLADVVKMRADGLGWGEIARAHGLHPGIGSVMGNGGGNGNGNGGGHGRENAPGQQKDRAGD